MPHAFSLAPQKLGYQPLYPVQDEFWSEPGQVCSQDCEAASYKQYAKNYEKDPRTLLD